MRAKIGPFLILPLFLLVICPARGYSAVLPPALLSGSWHSQEDDQILRFEAERVLVRRGGRVVVWGVESYKDNVLRVRVQGQLHRWPLTLEGNLLRIQKEKEVLTLRHNSETPSELAITPLKLGHGGELTPQRVQEIQQELARRLKEDQAVRKEPSRRGERARVDGENRLFLRSLVQEVGWIDTQRFGQPAAADAIILLQHTMDIALVSAVLPVIEKDFKEVGPQSELFAIVYDGLHIDLGQKQRFGTQLGEDPQGEPLVLPLESIEQVEAYRKELGLPPLKDYLAKASQVLYDGKSIRMPRADE